MPAQKAIGRNIRRLREERGLSQEALAERAGLHPVQIGRSERGAHDLKSSTIMKLARGLEVAPAELWRGIDF